MNVTVIGTGMIGGAVARAARRLAGVREVVGVDNKASHADAAANLGLVHRTSIAVPADADIIVIATPSEFIADWVVALRDHPATIMDVGSVKGHIIDAVRARLGLLPSRYVPCHPLAGSEKHGPQHAPDELFRGRLLIMTPVAETDPSAIELARTFWRDLGAVLHDMEPATHDRTLAKTSHLPHLLAFAFMQGIADEDLRFSGGGFKDFSRISASSPELWWKIFELNREPLLAALDRFLADVVEVRSALERGDAASGTTLLEQSANRRRKL